MNMISPIVKGPTIPIIGQKIDSPAKDATFDQSQKSFVERSMYKRELCKNWGDNGACRYGSKCQFAHGFDELSENHQLYVNE